MGEFINNLMRFAVWVIYLFLFVAILYSQAVSLAVDVHADVIQNGKSAVQKDRMKFVLLYALPKNLHAAMKLVFPPLADFRKVYEGKLFNERFLTPERVLWSLGVPLAALLLLIILIETMFYPLLRSKVARSLTDNHKQIYGKPRDLSRGDGFVIANDVRLARDAGGNPHVLTIAPSGSGKTTANVTPSALLHPADSALICTDPKGEILARTGWHLEKQGHPIRVLAPLAGYGYGWDPLKECSSADECRILARQLIQAGDESSGQSGNWNNMSRSCLSAYLIQGHDDQLGLADALQSLYADQASGEAISSPAALMDYRLFQTMAGSGNVVGSVLATLQGSTQVWLMDKVVGWMACPRQIKLSDIREKKMAVFLVTTASEMKETRPIQWLFFTRLFSELAKGGQNDVRIIMDEMANLGAIEGLDQALNLLRGAGVQLHAFVQNYSQLKQVYGADMGAVIAESFGTITVMAGLRKDADELAKLLGMEQELKASHSTMDEKMREQYSQNQKQALDGSMLRQIPKDQVLIVSGNIKPVMGRLKPWYKISKLRNRVMKAFQADWGKVPDAAKKNFFAKFHEIEPVQIVIPEPPKKQTKKKAERPGRKEHDLF